MGGSWDADDFRGFCMGSYTRPCLGFGGNSSWSSLPQHFKRHGYVTVCLLSICC